MKKLFIYKSFLFRNIKIHWKILQSSNNFVHPIYGAEFSKSNFQSRSFGERHFST